MELEELYKEIQPRIYAFFYVKTMSKESAEDLTQEVFCQAMKSVHSYSGNATIQTWLFAIAKNLLKKYYRSNKYKEKLDALLREERKASPSPEEEFLKKEKMGRLLEQVNRLEEPAREIVTLRVFGELSFKEMGQLLNKSENYTRITFHRAKLKLLKELEEDYETDKSDH